MSKTNAVRLVGHLGKNPEIIKAENKTSVLSISMATNQSYKDAGGNMVEKTEWHNIVCFGKVAELFEKYLKKGSYVMVLGRLQNRQYTDKNEIERYTTEIVCEEVLFLDSKKD